MDMTVVNNPSHISKALWYYSIIVLPLSFCVLLHDYRTPPQAVAPGSIVQTEPGVMTYMSPNIMADTDCRCTDCSRVMGGESCVVVSEDERLRE